MRWSSFCTDEELKQATLRMLNWQHHEGQPRACRFHVHDTKGFETVWVVAVDWIVNEFFNRAYKYGLRCNIRLAYYRRSCCTEASSNALQIHPNSPVQTVLF